MATCDHDGARGKACEVDDDGMTTWEEFCGACGETLRTWVEKS